MVADIEAGNSSPGSLSNSRQPPFSERREIKATSTLKGQIYLILHDYWHAFLGEEKGGEGMLYIKNANRGRNAYWLITLLGVRGKPRVLAPLLIYTAYLVGIVICLDRLQAAGNLVNNNPNVWDALQKGLALIGVALFFMMTFRVHINYGSWREGRAFLGRLFSQIRGIVNHVVSGQLKSRRLSLMMLRWCAALMQSIKLQLRDETTLDIPSLIGIINEEEVEEIKRVPVQGKWVFCVQKIEEAWNMGLDKDVVSRAMHKQLPHEVAKMRQACGAMLRLQNHGMVPFAYTAHVRSFLIVWLMVLPLYFFFTIGLWSILVCAALSVALFGIEAIGEEIESPFGQDFNDIPIDNLYYDLFILLKWAYAEVSLKLEDDTFDSDHHGVDWEGRGGSSSVKAVSPSAGWTPISTKREGGGGSGRGNRVTPGNLNVSLLNPLAISSFKE